MPRGENPTFDNIVAPLEAEMLLIEASYDSELIEAAEMWVQAKSKGQNELTFKAFNKRLIAVKERYSLQWNQVLAVMSIVLSRREADGEA